MDIHDLTINQLKRAISIKDQLNKLTNELRTIFGGSNRSRPGKKRTMSASAKKKIAASQKARWEKLRSAKPVTRSAKPAARSASSKRMSPAARAKLSAKLKAYWAARKKAGNK